MANDSGETGNDLFPWQYGSSEATGASIGDTLSNLGTTAQNYFQRVLSGQVASEGLEKLAGPAYVPGQSLAQMATDPERMAANTNVALGLGPGIIAGPEASAAALSKNLGTFQDAAKLEAGGATRREVFEQTGWFRGPTDTYGRGGQWQFIVPDEGASLRTDALDQTSQPTGRYLGLGRETIHSVPDSTGTPNDLKLSDILNHDDLYEAYPFTKNINVRPVDPMWGYTGGYDPNVNTIWLSPQNKEGMLSTLMHETQHAIQDHEGFPRGGAPDEFLPPGFRSDFQDTMDDRDKLARDIHVAGFDPELVAKEHGFYPYTAPNPAVQGHSAGLDPDIIQNYGDVSDYLGQLNRQHHAAYEDYQRMGGEVQSRAVEAMLRNQRWDMLPEEGGEFAYDPATGHAGGKTIMPYTPASQQLLIYPKQPWRYGGQGLPGPPPGYEGHSALPPAPEGYGYEPMPEGYDPFGGQQP